MTSVPCIKIIITRASRILLYYSNIVGTMLYITIIWYLLNRRSYTRDTVRRCRYDIIIILKFYTNLRYAVVHNIIIIRNIYQTIITKNNNNTRRLKVRKPSATILDIGLYFILFYKLDIRCKYMHDRRHCRVAAGLSADFRCLNTCPNRSIAILLQYLNCRSCSRNNL